MNIMIDLNIFIDVFQNRKPHYKYSSQILSLVLDKKITGTIAGHSVTTLFYLLNKSIGNEKTLEVLDWILLYFEIESADKNGFRYSRSLKMKDFEDAVIAGCAERAGCDYIVTRNTHDFKVSPVKALTPDSLLFMLKE